MKRNIFETSQEEKNRIISLHEHSSSKQYLNIINEDDEERFKPSPAPDFGFRLDRELVDDVINRLLDKETGDEYKQRLIELNSEYEPTQHRRIKREYEPLPPHIKVQSSIYPKD
jgi:hypothetical protein